jgi:predicted DNA binding protein
MLRTTSDVDAGIVSYGVYARGSDIYTHSAVYGDSRKSTTKLIEAITASELTDEVKELDQSYLFSDINASRPGNHTRGLLVQYRSRNSIYESLISRGFFPTEPIRVRNGNEYWTAATVEDRNDVPTLLESVADDENADITVEKVISSENASASNPRLQKLSERQREVFELAQQEGYYTWPREVSASDLAARVNITKATLLEHLRKAESKLLNF